MAGACEEQPAGTRLVGCWHRGELGTAPVITALQAELHKIDYFKQTCILFSVSFLVVYTTQLSPTKATRPA